MTLGRFKSFHTLTMEDRCQDSAGITLLKNEIENKIDEQHGRPFAFCLLEESDVSPLTSPSLWILKILLLPYQWVNLH